MAYAYVTADELAGKTGKEPEEEDNRLLDNWRSSQKAYLKDKIRENPKYASLSEKIVAAVLQALDGKKPDFDCARRIIERTRELRLQINWWPVQNRFWQLRTVSDQAGKVAALVGMRI